MELTRRQVMGLAGAGSAALLMAALAFAYATLEATDAYLAGQGTAAPDSP